MERLLKDAEKLTGKKYDISSYADIIDAIHAIQEEMGITGTTAEEADKTIEGSTRAMKASWQNLVTAFIRGDNVKQATQQFGERFKLMLDNLVPAITGFLDGFSVALDELAPVIDEQLPKIIESAVPAIIKTAGTVVKTVVKALPKLIKSAFNAGKRLLASVLNDVFGFNIDLSADEITFPSPSELAEGFGKWWDTVAVPALNSAMVWTLQLFGMPKEDAEAIAGQVGEWWDGIVGTVEAGIRWILSDPDNPAGDGESISDLVSGWWAGVKADAEGALNWVLGLPEAPYKSGLQLRENLSQWWQGFKGRAESVINWIIGTPDVPGEEETTSLVKRLQTWWDTTVVGQVVPGIERFVNALFGFGPKYSEDLSEAEIVELERLRKEAQAEADKLAGEFFDKNVWQPIADFFTPILQPISDFFAELRQVLVTLGLIREEGEEPVEFTYRIRTDLSADDEEFIKGLKAQYGEGTDLFIQRAQERGIYYDTGESTGRQGYYKIEQYTDTAFDQNQADIRRNKIEESLPPEERTITLEADTSAVTEEVGDLSLEANVTLIPDMSGWSDAEKSWYYDTYVNGSHAKGLDYVPYDNYVASLHRGEKVLTQSEARKYREGWAGISEGALVAAIQNGLSQMVVQMGEKSVGRVFGDATTSRVNRNIGRIERRRALAYGG